MSPLTLAMDTSTPVTTVGLWSEQFHGALSEPPTDGKGPGHASGLLGLVDRLLGQMGVDLGSVERVAVGLGPGSFTGLRIGIATAGGLAKGLGIPLVGVSSLEALLEGLPDRDAGAVAAVDARRGEFFVSQRGVEGMSLVERVITPEVLIEEARSIPGTLFVGDGVCLVRDQLLQTGVTVPETGDSIHNLNGEVLARLGAEADLPIGPVLPKYLRPVDAAPRAK